METAYEKLTGHVAHAITKFRMKPSEAVKFVLDDYPKTARRAAAELRDPQARFLAHARSYDRSGASKAEAFKEAARLHPDAYRLYDRQVRNGGRPSLTESSGRIDAKVKEYMRDSGEKDYLTALRRILAQSSRAYQNESAASQLLGAAKDVRAATGMTLIAALMEICNRDRALAKKVGDDFLNAEVGGKLKGADKGGSARAIVLREVMKEHPAVTKMWNAGIPNESAMREIFGDRI